MYCIYIYYLWPLLEKGDRAIQKNVFLKKDKRPFEGPAAGVMHFCLNYVACFLILFIVLRFYSP